MNATRVNGILFSRSMSPTRYNHIRDMLFLAGAEDGLVDNLSGGAICAAGRLKDLM